MKRSLILVVVSCLVFLPSPLAHAWLRPLFEDATVVRRSELIVVAHLKPETIKYVPHEKKPGEGASHEHHATLVITEVLKGKCSEKELPIIIHYGLTPVVSGHRDGKGSRIDFRGGREGHPEDIITIISTGGKPWGDGALRVKNASEDNLWFLRRRGGIYGREPGTGKFGIVDPEDLRPLKLKDYFLAYLSDDSEAAVREQMKTHPEITERAQRYLEHLEVQRILRITDPAERFEQLLPFYLERQSWGLEPEARQGILSCGDLAGERLVPLFRDPKRRQFRKDIIGIWGKIRYRDAVSILVELLTRHDRFWAKQDLQEGWWNNDTGSELTRRRRDIYGEVYSAVWALRLIKDPRAREVLEMTRKRWEAIDFDNPQIVEACKAALHELPETEGTTQEGAPAGEMRNVAAAGPEVPQLAAWDQIEKERVTFRGVTGWRYLFRRTLRVPKDPHQRPRRGPLPRGSFKELHSHLELIALPWAEVDPDIPASRYEWPQRQQVYHVETANLGYRRNDTVWLARGPIWTLVFLKKKLELSGGVEPIALLTRGLSVKDRGTMTANSCSGMLEEYGDEAIPHISQVVREGNDLSRWKAIYTLGGIRTKKSTQTLLELYGKRKSRRAAAYALIRRPYRKEAKQAYLDMLRREVYADRVVEACVEYKWHDCLPVMEDVLRSTTSFRVYRAVYYGKRSVEGNPLPQELVSAKQRLLDSLGEQDAEMRNTISQATQDLLCSPDVPAVRIIALEIATFSTKATYRKIEEIRTAGREILAGLPPQPTLDLVERFLGGENSEVAQDSLVKIKEKLERTK